MKKLKNQSIAKILNSERLKDFKSSPLISKFPTVPTVPMVLIVLIVLTFSCTTPADPQPATLHVYITSECIVDIRLFTTDGKELTHRHYDCQETKFLDISLYESGPIIIHAQTPTGKTEKKVVTLASGHITQTTLTF